MSQEYHREQAIRAREIYIQSRAPDRDALRWTAWLDETRALIEAALGASNYLRDVQAALLARGEFARVFRHVLLPPLSQDQLELCYPAWSKSSEKPDGPACSQAGAQAFARAVSERRSKALTPWLDASREPTASEVEQLVWSVAPLIASQSFATEMRNRISREQEQSVITILEANQWVKLRSSLLDTRAALKPKHYMHKTRFATATATAQEVDIALGLNGTVVMAMECKVTNDETNSVKRVNDVLKKARAWKEHWGSFVRTAALLQGVIAEKDVVRLLDAEVEVFWSHDLARFEAWIAAQT